MPPFLPHTEHAFFGPRVATLRLGRKRHDSKTASALDTILPDDVSRSLESRDPIDFVAEINEAINASESSNLEDLAEHILDVMNNALRCIGGALLLVEPEKKILRPLVYSKINLFVNRVIPHLKRPFRDYLFDISDPQNFTARAATECRTFVGHDYRDFMTPTLGPTLARTIQRLVRMRTIATAPVRLGRDVVGVLMVGFAEAQLAPERIRLLELFAGQCAVAINNGARMGEIVTLLHRERELGLRLRTADKMKSDLLLMAGHELRTPLAAVRYGLEALSHNAAQQPDQGDAKFLDQLVGQIQQLDYMVENICQTLRALHDRLELTGVPVDLEEMIGDIIERRESELREHRITMTLNTGALANVPVVFGDPSHLRYALWELLTNAVKHGGDGVKVEIEVTSAQLDREEALRIDVKDSGKGISEELQSRLFEEQFTVESTLEHKSTPGMGLGLYLVSKIVDLHRGRIEVHSTPGSFTQIGVLLPCFAAPAPSGSEVP